MQKYARLWLVVALMGLVGVGVWLYTRWQGVGESVDLPGGITGLVTPGAGGNERQGIPDRVDGEVIITYGDSELENAQYYRVGVLNKVSVVQVDREPVQVDDVTVPTLTLTVEFDYKGATRRLQVPYSKEVFDVRNSQTVDVGRVEVKPGDTINIGLMYVFHGATGSPEKIRAFCEKFEDTVCLYYLDRGWGSIKVELEEYLGTLSSEQVYQLDTMQIIPVSIYVLGV